MFVLPGFDREAQVVIAAGQCLLTMFKSGAPFSTSTTRQSVFVGYYHVIMIVIGWIGIFIPVVSNRFKALQGRKLQSLLPVGNA